MEIETHKYQNSDWKLKQNSDWKLKQASTRIQTELRNRQVPEFKLETDTDKYRSSHLRLKQTRTRIQT